jgi:hypothetical protein
MNALKLLAVAALMAATSTVAQAQAYGESIDESPSATAMAFDLLIVRPLGLVATVGGMALFIAQLPLAVIQLDVPDVPNKKLVVEPARYTFVRPLGEMQ